MKKIYFNKILAIFLFSHFVIWVVVPSISNNNLPLDVIEGIAWGDGWPLGFDKHPPLSSWFPEIFFQVFGNQDWSYYLLSQIFVIISFFVVWKLSLEFFENKNYSLISILILESIFFYNFTTPEFNVNVCQLPFWALSVLYFWKGIKDNKIRDWLIFGFFAALGVLSKYLFIYLLLSMDIFFIYLILKKKFNYKSLFSLISFLIVLLPHLIWLVDNNYITIQYGLKRTGLETSNLIDHIVFPLIFLAKQIGILSLFFLMLFLIIKKIKVKINVKDEKLVFLFFITVFPLILMFLTSFFMGAKIRTMWMTPFYLFFGVFFIYLYKKNINLNKIKHFSYLFLILFILSPITYLYVYAQNEKRTDYPGKKISKVIQYEWDKNFSNKIEVVVGSEWYAGNLIYNLKTRPKWKQRLDLEKNEGTVLIKGFNEINDCKGILYKVYNYNDVCMFGK